MPHLHVGAEPALEEVVGVESLDLQSARGDEVGLAAAGGGGDVGGAPGPGEVERAAELVEDERPPERVVGGDDVERLGRGRERREVARGEEAQDVEEQVVRERPERAQPRVPEVAARGGGEEEVSERLDEASDVSRGGGAGASQVERVGVVLLWVTASAAALGFALPFEGEEGVEGARHSRLRASGSGGGGGWRGRRRTRGVLGSLGKTGEAGLSIRDGRTRGICAR